MGLDRQRLIDALESRGYTVEFDSEDAGIEFSEGKRKSWEELDRDFREVFCMEEE